VVHLNRHALMYNSFRQICERWLRIPPEPEPPPGDEAKTQIFRAAPNFYKYLLMMWLVKTVAPILFLSIFMIAPLIALLSGKGRGAQETFWVVFILEVFVVALVLISRVIALAMVRLDFEKRWYVVTDRSLRVREGIVLVREATVTFANIQNISISQGPIQRMLGIADLRVDTAGGGGAVQAKHGQHNLHTVLFRGVDNASAIKELMQQRLRQLKDSGLGDHEEFATQTAPAIPSNVVAALREVHAEATALRAAANRRTHTA
jgi:uncharacterized membrane protein YdbT with pleckstrin-like domain